MSASLDSQASAAKSAAAGLGPGERDTVAGRYKLLELIAQGGMGSVYRAEHLLSRKKLALKVVFPYLCRGRQGAERFRREVSAAAEIDHPGIVQVYDAGTDDDGGFFMAMELLEGESLGDLLRRDWPGMASAVHMVEGMLEPLAKAHAKGFVHRDLKPDNIFLAKSEEGATRVKLLDFGLAREVTKGGPTRTGTTFGTPEYMSPEQAMSARQVKPPGDVWSVGVMLYELLSGQHPFVGETPTAIMANAIKEPLVPIRDVAPHVPEPLAALIARSLEKTPEGRPQTAGEMLDELRAVLARVKLDETVPDAPQPPASWDDEEEEEQEQEVVIEASKSSLPEIVIGLPVVSQVPSMAFAVPTPSIEGPAVVEQKGKSRGVVFAVVGVLSLFVVAGAAAGIYIALDDTSAPRETAIVAPRRAPEREAEPTPAPTKAAPAAQPAVPEPVPAEPVPVPANERRAQRRVVVAPVVEEGPSALEEARACQARGDRRCARDVLAARGRSSAERAMLIEIYRSGGETSRMLDAMEAFVRRFPRASETAGYRNDLRTYGRL